MDREVISIGGSSLEDTRHGAFDNKSFSLERFRVLGHTGGGTSRLRGRAQLFAAFSAKEHVPITMILPPFCLCVCVCLADILLTN